MRLSVALLLLSLTRCSAYTPRGPIYFGRGMAQSVLHLAPEPQAATESLTQDLISKLRYRELQAKLEQRKLDKTGTTSQLRIRLKEAEGLREECVVNEDEMGDDCTDDSKLLKLVSFVDVSDRDIDRTELLREIEEKVGKGHWKAATRKLKRLSRRYGAVPVPEKTLNAVLEICMENRLQGARASEPARKILELMVELGYPISEKSGNHCIQNCLGYEVAHSTHEGFGGIDTALAMVAAMEQSNTPLQLATYERLIVALAREGSLDDSLTMLRKVVAVNTETPTLATFASVAFSAVVKPELEQAEKVLTILAYAKAAGYELDTIASLEDGRKLLASGIIAAEILDNVALGLRLLTAASKAPGVEPDRGDDLVASSSSLAQRAATLIHKRAINRAVEDKQWKLAVKLLRLMLERSLSPSPWIWRNIVTCIAKAERSKKAAALLLEWVQMYERGETQKPPLSVFNTVMNACEIRNEQELTLEVLDAMKKTHETEGNIITFNIALKRLAKQANYAACEGMIVGMLKEGIAPTVVSYTTAIAACVSNEAAKQPALAYEWLRRMRSLKVQPNVLTYNTALAACLDGTLASAMLGSKIASELFRDVDKQLENASLNKVDDYTNVIPDSSTKFLSRRLLEQVDKAVQAGEIDERVASESIKKPLTAISEFESCTTDECFLNIAKFAKADDEIDEDEIEATSRDEVELEYLAASEVHRIAEV